MAHLIDEAEEMTWISIPLDPQTAARLRNLSDACHAAPTNIAASLLHDILKDDEEANLPAAIAVGTVTMN
jgi:predicted transcriptional regulator